MSENDNNFDYRDAVTLKEFLLVKVASVENTLTSKIHAVEDKVEMTFKLNAIAIDKAERLMGDRLAGMNEFRDALKDQTKSLLPKSEHDAVSARQDEAIDRLQSNIPQLVTRNEHSEMMTRIEKQIRDLELSKALLEGKASQTSVNVSLAIGLIGLLIGIFSIVLRLTHTTN
jgi:hypothetical protein